MVNYWAILVCGVASMVVGFLWYGPLFGKTWMKIMGVEHMTAELKERMRKAMWGMYALQFALSLITAWVLSIHIVNWTSPASAVGIAVCSWFGFVMTTTASGALWSGKTPKMAWKMFFISASAQLVTFIVIGLIIGAWR